MEEERPHNFDNPADCWCKPHLVLTTMHGIKIVIHNDEHGEPTGGALEIAELVVDLEFDYSEDEDGRFEPKSFIDRNYVPPEIDFPDDDPGDESEEQGSDLAPPF